MCASLADCFVLTFRAVSRAAHFNWLYLDCRVEGVLERVGQNSQFTRYNTYARLKVPEHSDIGKAHALLERAERACLIANSLTGERMLHADIELETVGARSAVA